MLVRDREARVYLALMLGSVLLVAVFLSLNGVYASFSESLRHAAFNVVSIASQVASAQVMQSVLAFMLIYGLVMVAVSLLLLLSGMDLISAATAAIACINNTGPGLGQVGPANNYQGLTDFQTWVCSVAMLLGRLELLSVLVLFTPSFWRR